MIRALAIVALIVLSACAVPDHYARLEDPAAANKCVAQLLDVEPKETLPFVVYEDGPFSINYGGQRRKANGLWSHTGDVRVIKLARGPRMAATLFHEMGHDYGLPIINGHDYAEDLVRRMRECEDSP